MEKWGTGELLNFLLSFGLQLEMYLCLQNPINNHIEILIIIT